MKNLVGLSVALALGLAAVSHPALARALAQPAAAPPVPPLELVLDSDPQWMDPELLVVSFALRNTGTEPVVVAQHPGLFLGFFCLTENGGRGSVPGGTVCGVAGAAHGTYLQLAPGEALLGEKVLQITADCVRGLNVEGFFQTFYGPDGDLPGHEAKFHSKPLSVDMRGQR